MSYQGSTPYGSDFAKSAVGVTALFTTRKLFTEMDQVIEKPHSEQSILVYLQCLRKLAEDFPEAVNIHFGRKKFEKAKSGFYEWFAKAEKKIPAKYRKGLMEEAEAEFLLWQDEVLFPERKKS